MKKIAIILSAIALMSGAAYAMSNPDFIENVPGINFKPSTNVKISYGYDSASTNPQNYLIASKNTAGDTIYAGSNAATTIYKKQVSNSAGQALTLSDTNVTALSKAGESVFTGFSPM